MNWMSLKMNLMMNVLRSNLMMNPKNMRNQRNMKTLMNDFLLQTWLVKNILMKICSLIRMRILPIQHCALTELNNSQSRKDVKQYFSDHCYMKECFSHCCHYSGMNFPRKTFHCFRCCRFLNYLNLNLLCGCCCMKALCSFWDYYSLADRFFLSSCIPACCLQIPVMMKLTSKCLWHPVQQSCSRKMFFLRQFLKCSPGKFSLRFPMMFQFLHKCAIPVMMKLLTSLKGLVLNKHFHLKRQQIRVMTKNLVFPFCRNL